MHSSCNSQARACSHMLSSQLARAAAYWEGTESRRAVFYLWGEVSLKGACCRLSHSSCWAWYPILRSMLDSCSSSKRLSEGKVCLRFSCTFQTVAECSCYFRRSVSCKEAVPDELV